MYVFQPTYVNNVLRYGIPELVFYVPTDIIEQA